MSFQTFEQGAFWFSRKTGSKIYFEHNIQSFTTPYELFSSYS